MDYREWSESEIHAKACRVYGYAREVASDLPLKQDAVISDAMLCDGYDLYQEDYERLAEFIRAVHEGRYRDDRQDHIAAMMDFVDEHCPCSYTYLMRYANEERPEWFRCMFDGGVWAVMKEYCRAARDAKV